MQVFIFHVCCREQVYANIDSIGKKDENRVSVQTYTNKTTDYRARKMAINALFSVQLFVG